MSKTEKDKIIKIKELEMRKWLVLFIMLISTLAYAVDPWYRPMPTLVRTVNIHSQSDLNSWVPMEGDYAEIYPDTTYSGNFTITEPNIVVRGHGTPAPLMTGSFTLQASNVWIRDLHFVNTLAVPTAITMYWNDDAAVNNVIEGDYVSDGQVGIFINALGGANKLVYGNVIRGKEHEIYLKHKGSTGLMYVAHNYLADTATNSNGYLVHEYSQDADQPLENINYVQNAFANGTVLIGGEVDVTVPLENVIKESVFSHAGFQAWKRPHGTDFLTNFFAYGGIDSNGTDGLAGFQGDGGDPDHIFGIADNYTVTGNTFYNPNGYFVKFKTSRYITHPGGSREDGLAPIRTTETFDINRYYGSTGKWWFYANGTGPIDLLSIGNWRTYTLNAGKQFDVNSTFSTGVPPARYWHYVNTFDSSRGFLIVWGRKSIIWTRTPNIASVNDPYNYSLAPATIGTTGEVTVWLVKYN